MKFNVLAQKNVDFYNDHKTAHTTLSVVYGVVAFVVVSVLCKKIAGADKFDK